LTCCWNGRIPEEEEEEEEEEVKVEVTIQGYCGKQGHPHRRLGVEVGYHLVILF